MNAHLLIDAVVQQTMVFIAQLATAGGVRAPLAHVAEQVFLDLTGELRTRGVKKNVIADMFGMALRTYHRRIRELEESKTDSGRSVWEAVLGYIRQRSPSALESLMKKGRVVAIEGGAAVMYASDRFEVSLHAPNGWEAAVLDHFQAVVTAIIAKLSRRPSAGKDQDLVGGSTWSLDVWPGHPLEVEAKGLLRTIRATVEDLRSRIDAHNAMTSFAGAKERVVVYAGQNVREGTASFNEGENDSDDDKNT